ncbi:DUF4412 domain-containing protein [Candidatus Zixiibacteriota bacterium]
MSFRKPVGLFILILAATLCCSRAFAAEFTAELRIIQPQDSVTLKLYVRDHLYRVEKLEGEDQMIAIENRQTDMTTALNPEEKTYLELKGSEGAFANPVKGWGYLTDGTEETAVGPATVNGLECEHYTYAYPGQAEPFLEIWKSKKLDHFVKYLVHYGAGSGDGSLELINVVEEAVDDELFTVPAGYTRLKTDEEIELERPAITVEFVSESPVGRRLAPGGELRVKTDPEISIRVQLQNLIKDTSSCQIHILKGGQKIDFGEITPPPEETFSLSYSGERREPLYGQQYQADEVRIKLNRGRMMVTVYQEYSSFDEVKRYQYYVAPPGRGIAAIEGHPINIKIIGDSPAAAVSKIKLHVYQQEFVDGLEQKNTIDKLEFELKNGEVKALDYPLEKKADYFNIEVEEGGGVKLFTEQP